jgi:hypothetical protein
MLSLFRGVSENSLRIAPPLDHSIVTDQRDRRLSSKGRRERIWLDRFNGVATKYLPNIFAGGEHRKKPPLQ